MNEHAHTSILRSRYDRGDLCRETTFLATKVGGGQEEGVQGSGFRVQEGLAPGASRGFEGSRDLCRETALLATKVGGGLWAVGKMLSAEC
jgi:hypothetical protein